jgi:acetyltransferase-like isoleucine patch superfamily enzyme
VWIGAGVQVMPGVTIGSNVVIGGGSVVVHDIPDNVVAVGNPCRPVRPITPCTAQGASDKIYTEI